MNAPPLISDPETLALGVAPEAQDVAHRAVVADRAEIRRAMQTLRDTSRNLSARHEADLRFEHSDLATEYADSIEAIAAAVFGADWEAGL